MVRREVPSVNDAPIPSLVGVSRGARELRCAIGARKFVYLTRHPELVKQFESLLTIRVGQILRREPAARFGYFESVDDRSVNPSRLAAESLFINLENHKVIRRLTRGERRMVEPAVKGGAAAAGDDCCDSLSRLVLRHQWPEPLVKVRVACQNQIAPRLLKQGQIILVTPLRSVAAYVEHWLVQENDFPGSIARQEILAREFELFLSAFLLAKVQRQKVHRP